MNTASGQIFPSNKNVYIMRAKQLYGSAVKMNILINDEIVYKISNGERVHLNIISDDIIKIHCTYPLMKRYLTESILLSPQEVDDTYLKVFYWGESYNPLKHYGYSGESPDFNVEIEKLEIDAGHSLLLNDELFKKRMGIKEITISLTER